MAQKELCNFETELHSYIQKQPIQHLMDKFSFSFTTVIRLKKRRGYKNSNFLYPLSVKGNKQYLGLLIIGIYCILQYIFPT